MKEELLKLKDEALSEPDNDLFEVLKKKLSNVDLAKLREWMHFERVLAAKGVKP